MRLLALALRRFLWMPPTLLGLTLIVFSVSHVIPSDPARVLAGENASIEQVETLRRKFGLDQPLPVQFVRYVSDVVGGNMGISLYTQRPVATDLIERLPATFELALFAIALAIMLGLPLGDPSVRGVAAMVNIVGTEPDLAALLAIPGASVHTYGKAPRTGRKLAHVTLVADSAEALAVPLAQARVLCDAAWDA